MGKNVTIERLTNEENFLVDDCLFLLSKDKGKIGAFVEKLKILMDEVKADVPNPPSRNTRDVIGGIFSISKPSQIVVQNPTKAVNKGEHLKKGERLKSEREKTLKVRAKRMKQKAKVEWLDEGDSNSAYFHKSIKSRNQRSRIELILNTNNGEVIGNSVSDVFVCHYEHLLGTSMDYNNLNVEDLFSKTISVDTAANMVLDVTNDEIKVAMFDIGDDKSLGPDGYTFVFFKKGWSIVSQDVCNAVRDFFSNGFLLKEINHTFVALIPKVCTPLRVNDYHLISCSNVIYKCISKIITNRIIDGIKEVVSDNQSAFIPSRHILNNILITQELVHNYHWKRGPPRCAYKIDIQKAYDMVD
ncbi:putative RNA-directed DNA polymerase, eukaryota, reverse transcriptase zinc-binding domain protein [Tanacetum coccineum]